MLDYTYKSPHRYYIKKSLLLAIYKINKNKVKSLCKIGIDILLAIWYNINRKGKENPKNQKGNKMEKLTRSDLMNLALACLNLKFEFEKEGKKDSAEKWRRLHEKVKEAYESINIEE